MLHKIEQLLRCWFDHPPQLLAGKEVNMEVGNLLMSIFTLVGQYAATAFNHAKLFCHFPNGAHQTNQFRITRLLAKIGLRNIRPLWNDEYMNGSLRIDVFKGQCVVILVNLFARNFATENFGEDIFVIIPHCPNPFASNFFPQFPTGQIVLQEHSKL